MLVVLSSRPLKFAIFENNSVMKSHKKNMKKILIFAFILILSGVSHAQEQAPEKLSRGNVFKFLPINIPFQSLSFEYERMINPKNSFTIGVGIPTQKSIIGMFGSNETSSLKTANFSTMHVRAAYRHYTGKSQLPRGFYVEPYVKYQDISCSAGVSGTESQYFQPYASDLSIKLNTMNFGLQFGTQILIAKRVSLDFYFLGVEAGFLRGDLSGTVKLTNSNLPSNADQILTSATNTIVSNINSSKTDVLPAFIGNKITISQTGNRVNAKINGVPYPWLRAGISLGIAF